MLTVPATSLKGLKQYSLHLMKFGCRPDKVVTRLGLEAARSSTNVAYSKLTFTKVGTLSDEEAAKVKALGDVMREAFLEANPLDAPTPQAEPEADAAPADQTSEQAN